MGRLKVTVRAASGEGSSWGATRSARVGDRPVEDHQIAPIERSVNSKAENAQNQRCLYGESTAHLLC
jgi:hypothetical protein